MTAGPARALSLIDRGDRRFVLKRTSPSRDWIVRATHDDALREAWFATALAATGPGRRLDPAGQPVSRERLPTATMRRSSCPTCRRSSSRGIARATSRRSATSLLASVLMAVARLHVIGRRAPGTSSVPWCPVPDRIGLLSRPAAERYRAEGNPVGARFLAGWDAFDRHAPGPARRWSRVWRPTRSRSSPRSARLPPTMLHGDLKLSNVASLVDGIALIDWQMASLAPVAVELGWFLVSNVAQLPEGPETVLDRYRASVDAVAADVGLDAGIGDWEAQVDLAFVIGLLLRGWRKGLDAEAGLVLPTGVTAADDLGWWCDRALEAAARRL